MTADIKRNIETDEEIEDSTGDAELPFRYSISSYGADYPVDGLVRRLKDGTIYVPPFQRSYVWSLRDASRFIESLLLGLPVPGVFLAREEPTNKLLVIDGHQRLRSLQFFYDRLFGPSGREFKLEGVQDRYEGRTFETLDIEDRRHLDDSIIHATVTRQDIPSDDDSSVYHVFERLNTGGKVLSGQEIRACLYHGPFDELIAELNDNADWRAVFGPPNKRQRDQELVLRFFAMRHDDDNYFRPLKGFLNQFMKSNRKLQRFPAKKLKDEFENTVSAIRAALGDRPLRPEGVLNAAILDSVMVAVCEGLDTGVVNTTNLKRGYDALLTNEAYLASTKGNTAQQEQVERRLKLAREAFGVS
jgi:uncharacterized protein with ParB-like and HNH nuclease domain